MPNIVTILAQLFKGRTFKVVSVIGGFELIPEGDYTTVSDKMDVMIEQGTNPSCLDMVEVK